jgi:D-alanyl-D-alanine carboxypeptidase
LIDGIDCLIAPGVIMRQLVWPTLAILLVASTLDAQTRTTAELPGTRTFGPRTAAKPPRSAIGAREIADRVDEYIEAEMRKQQIPGLSLAVVQAGKVVKMKGYGLGNVELNVSATPNTVYELQSITKSFVACGIMLLVEEGKLGFDDKITKNLSGLPDAWRDVTVRHVLTHTSGIPSFVQDQGSGQAIIAFAQKVSSSDEIVGWAAARPLKFAPGEGRKYSSTGYHLLGMIIEKVTGKPWGQFLHERIFAPLGMSSTRVYSSEDIIPNRASGYLRFGDLKNGLWFTPAYRESAAGGLVSTVEDMARWESALEAGTILKLSTLAQMQVPIRLRNDSVVTEGDGTRHGLGWDLPTYQGHRIMAHGGDHVSGFTANFYRFIDDKVGIIVLTNLMPMDIGVMTHRIAGFYIPALLPAKTRAP